MFKILSTATIAGMMLFAIPLLAAERTEGGGGMHNGGIHNGGMHNGGGFQGGGMHRMSGERRGSHRGPGGWYNANCEIVPYVTPFYYDCPGYDNE
jgi:hypothetical protein